MKKKQHFNIELIRWLSRIIKMYNKTEDQSQISNSPRTIRLLCVRLRALLRSGQRMTGQYYFTIKDVSWSMLLNDTVSRREI